MKSDNIQTPSKQLNNDVIKAIQIQEKRFDKTSQKFFKNAMEKLNLSARAYDRILKVARTIADLEKRDGIKPGHVAEAIQYRSLDRESWGV
jgi:magnesium chelatase family protein